MSDAPLRVPDFELLRPIGRGGYGEVWLARSVTGVWRAVKVVERARFEDARPFEREFAGVRSYQRAAEGQPHQLALLHVGRDEAAGRFHYVMELADDANDVVGGSGFHPDTYVPLTLKELRRRRGGQVPAAEVVRLALPLARALAFLHGHRLIHRDVKPSNIVLVQGVPKLADLGLVSSSEVTHTSVGTPGYSPPEGPGTMTADRYSLGKVMYELATGLAPLEFPKLPREVAERGDARELRELNEVLLKACAPRVEERYPDTAAMVADLELLLAGKSVAEYETRQRRWRRLGQGLMAVTALAVVVAGLVAWRARAVERQRRETRAAEYQAGLAAVRRALTAEDFGSAQAGLERLIPAPGDVDLRGFEWRALAREATGAPAVSWRPSPSAIVALAPTTGSTGLVAATAAGWFSIRATSGEVGPPVLQVGLDPVASLAWAGNGLVFARPGGWAGWAPGSTNVTPRPGGTVLDFARDGRFGLFWERSPGAGQTNSGWVVRELDAGQIHRSGPPETGGAQLITGALARGGELTALAWFTEQGPVRERWVEVWETATGVRRWRVPVSARVDSLAFSSDGAVLALTRGGNGVVTLATTNGAQLAAWTAGSGQLNALEFSPEGESLATGGDDQVVRLWQARTGNREQSLRGHRAPVRAIRWPSRDRLHSAAEDGEIRTWTALAAPEVQLSAVVARADVFADLRCSPDGRSLLVRNPVGTLAEVDPVTLRTRREFNDGATLPLAFAPDGATGGATLWNFNRALQLERRQWPTGTILSTTPPLVPWVAGACDIWTASAHWLAAGQADGRIQLWELPSTNAPVAAERTWQAHGGAVSALALSRDGHRLASGDAGGELRIWPLSAGTPPSPQERARTLAGVESLSWSPDGLALAAVLADGRVLWEDLVTGRREEDFAANRTSATAVIFLADGSRLISGGKDGRVVFWALRPLRPVFTEYPPADGAAAGSGPTEVAALAASADGSTVAALGRDGRVRIWRARAE